MLIKPCASLTTKSSNTLSMYFGLIYGLTTYRLIQDNFNLVESRPRKLNVFFCFPFIRLTEAGPGKPSGEQEQLFRQIDDFAAEQSKLLSGGTGESNNSRKSSHGSSADRRSNGSSGGRKSGSDKSNASGRPSQIPRLITKGQPAVSSAFLGIHK